MKTGLLAATCAALLCSVPLQAQKYECVTTTTTTTTTQRTADGAIITTTIVVSQRVCMEIAS